MRLQLGRRVNTADGLRDLPHGFGKNVASIGPPREHGGWVPVAAGVEVAARVASIGPPREHGGWSRSGMRCQNRHPRFNWAAA